MVALYCLRFVKRIVCLCLASLDYAFGVCVAMSVVDLVAGCFYIDYFCWLFGGMFIVCFDVWWLVD